jgi:hypothetical protein
VRARRAREEAFQTDARVGAEAVAAAAAAAACVGEAIGQSNVLPVKR